MQHTTSCIVECAQECPCPCHTYDIITDLEKQFLQESNEIEGVFDFKSLDQAMTAWKYLKSHIKLNTHIILKTHKLLMLNQPGLYPNEKGYFRTKPVYIAGRECPVEVGGYNLSTVISKWAQEANLYPEEWRQHHINFENIHPFADGNGRIGRMLMNWEVLKAGLPVLVVKANDRQNYYQWFK